MHRQNTYQFSKVRETRSGFATVNNISGNWQSFALIPVISVEEESLYIPDENDLRGGGDE